MGYSNPQDQRDYQRKWYADRRAAWFEGKVCVLCGSAEDLEVDHIDPATKITSRVWSWSAERREAELSKCRALCHDCHQRKSAGEVARGERVGVSKLTADDVRAIRASNVRPYKLLAERYGVDTSLIGLVIRNRIWRHVT